jgi:hypothetical protein
MQIELCVSSFNGRAQAENKLGCNDLLVTVVWSSHPVLLALQVLLTLKWGLLCARNMCKINSRCILLGQCDAFFQASRQRGSIVRADADARFSWQIVRTKIAVDNVKNMSAFLRSSLNVSGHKEVLLSTDERTSVTNDWATEANFILYFVLNPLTFV